MSKPLPLLLALASHNSAALSDHLAGVAVMPTRPRLMIRRSCRKKIARFSTIKRRCGKSRLVTGPVGGRESRSTRGEVDHGRCQRANLGPDPLLMHRFFASTARDSVLFVMVVPSYLFCKCHIVDVCVGIVSVLLV